MNIINTNNYTKMKNVHFLRKMPVIALAMTLAFSGLSAVVNAQVVDSGTCGNGLTYEITGTAPDLTLHIIYDGAGTGVMNPYAVGTTPWYVQRANLKTLVIDNGVTVIANYAFADCYNLSGTLTIPNSVTSIDSYAFYGCGNFTGNLIIPNSVTSIGNSAFNGCIRFTGDLIIPNSILTIGSLAFRNCNGFTGTLTIPNSVTSIGYSAFWECSGFTGTLTIPNSVTSIGTNTFRDCSGFTGTLTIPDFVATIGTSAFSGCSGFTGTLTIPNSVTTIESSAFSFCDGLTALIIGNSVTSIGNGAFQNCSGFTGTLTIPDLVATIESNAFNLCSGLTALIIGNSVTSIGNSAFQNCSGLQTIHSRAIVPPSLGSNAFRDVPATIPVYVPCDNFGNYQTDWSYFSNFYCGNLNYLLTVFSNDYSLGDAPFSYSNPAVLYATPKPTAIFTGWSDGNIDNPRTVTLTSDSTFTAIFVANNTDSLLQKIMDYELQITGLENDTALCNNNVLALLEQIDNLETDTAALNLQIAGLENDLDDCELDKILLQALLYACQSSLDSCLNGLTGTKSLQSPPMFRVYPNPVSSNGILNIENETLQAGDKIEIYDMSGKLLSINYALGTETAIKIGALPSGTYLLRLAGQRGVKFEVR